MNNWLNDDNKITIVCDYLAENDICPDKLYDKDLEDRFVRALFLDLYACNEKGVWDYLSENYDEYIRS